MPGKNTLAYLASSSATKEKSFTTLKTGISVINLFFVTDDEAKLPRAFVLGKLLQPGLIVLRKAKSLPMRGSALLV